MKKLIAIILFLTIWLFDIRAQEQPIPGFPPEDVTNIMDFNQMMKQMGIELPKLPSRKNDPNRPKGSVPANPQNPEGSWSYNGHNLNRSAWGLWDNYDDLPNGFFPGRDSFRVGKYTPVMLLKTKKGEQVASAKDWWEKRRPEIADDILGCLYGYFPPEEKLPAVTFNVIETVGGKGNNAYYQKEITGVIDVSSYPEVRNKPFISATLKLPASATGPVPVMIVFGGFGNTVDNYWKIVSPHGWGICSFSPNTLQPDNGAGLTSYVIGLVNKGNWRKPEDWGTIGVWAWGISRLIDYLETDPKVDCKAIGLTGHSRYGKATLFATAFEPRIAIAFPSDAGSLGTKMNRRHWGQDLENSGSPSEYHWMAGNFLQWCGELKPRQYLPRKIEKCPVDAHSLLALCAPRPVFFNGGNQSQWSDPYGIYLTMAHTTPVYELLDHKGLIIKDEKPVIDVAYIEGDLGYRYHDGGHTDVLDWPAFFAFASKFVKATELNISTDVLTVPQDGKAQTLKIQTNKECEINNHTPWLKIDKRVTDGDASIEISANENTTGFGRSSTLILETEGKKLTVAVNQLSDNNVFGISKNEVIMSGDSETSDTFNITSKTAWNIKNDAEWLLIDPVSGINTGRISVSALANPLIEKRLGTLTITSGRESKSITVTQKEGLPVLQVFGNPIVKVDAKTSSNSSVMIATNAECTVESFVEWVSGTINRQGWFTRLVLTIEENKTGKPRSTKIGLKVKGLETVNVKVIQGGK